MDPEIFYIAHHTRNKADLDQIENWPCWKIWQVHDYLQAIDEAEYKQYLKSKPKA